MDLNQIFWSCIHIYILNISALHYGSDSDVPVQPLDFFESAAASGT
jgi:hypothetical protein